MSVFGGSGDLWSNLFLFLLMLMGLYKVRSRRVEAHKEAATAVGRVHRTCHTRALSLAALPARSAPVKSSSDASSQPPGEYAALLVLICRWLVCAAC